MFAGPYKLSATEMASLRMGLNDVMPEDFNGDGEKYAEMVMMQIFSDAQEAEIKATPDDEIPPYRGQKRARGIKQPNPLSSGTVQGRRQKSEPYR